MITDKLKQFVSLRDALVREQAELQARLAEINQALASQGAAVSEVAAEPEEPVVSRAPRTFRRGRGRIKNKMSLGDAVRQVTKSRPMGRKEILEGVLRLGYKFTAKDPLNSLSTLLYTDKRIKNYGGKFGPA